MKFNYIIIILPYRMKPIYKIYVKQCVLALTCRRTDEKFYNLEIIKNI